MKPDFKLYLQLFKMCTAHRNLETGKMVLSNFLHSKFQHNVYLHNAGINMCVKCEDLELAQEVFDEMRERDVISYNMLISGYSQISKFKEALRLFIDLMKMGLQPDEITFSSTLKSAAGMQSDAIGSGIHGTCIKYRCRNKLFVGNALVDMYNKAGNIGDAEKIFHHIVKKDVVSWSSMINAYEHHGLNQEALDLFEEMCGVGLRPNEITFLSALKSAAGMHSDAIGRKIHGTCIKHGYEKNVKIGSSLVDMYGKAGSIADTEKAFHRLVEKDVVSWNSMINAYEHHGLNQEAVDLFEEMCAVGLLPDEITLLSAVNSAAGMPSDAMSHKIHGTCIKYGYQKNMFIGNALVDMYGKSGIIGDAEKVFHRMVTKDIVSWSSMINAFSHHGLNQEAVDLFEEMCAIGLRPTDITLSTVLKSVVGMQSSAMAIKIHGTCIKHGYGMNVSVVNHLVNMYAKLGSIEDAEKVFHRLVKKDVISFNSMLCSYSIHGRSQHALNIFEEMISVGLVPNEITFLTVLTACNHAGLVEKGFYYFELMRKFKLEPKNRHYTIIVDTLARAGQLDHAERVIKEMPIRPTVFEWTCLLGGCCQHENFELGAFAAERVLELDPLDPEAHTVLYKMYMTSDRFNDATKVMEMMNQKGLKRSGVSRVEIRN